MTTTEYGNAPDVHMQVFAENPANFYLMHIDMQYELGCKGSIEHNALFPDTLQSTWREAWLANRAVCNNNSTLWHVNLSPDDLLILFHGHVYYSCVQTDRRTSVSCHPST